MNSTKPDTLLWLDANRGIYIPRDFALSIDRVNVSGVSTENWAILEAGPDHEYYWDAWCEVCDHAVITDTNADGTQYRIHQNDDCWLVPVGMEWNDDKELFMWPEAEQDPDHAREDRLERNV